MTPSSPLARPCLWAALLFAGLLSSARADLVWTLSEGAGDSIVGTISGTINVGSLSLAAPSDVGGSSEITTTLSNESGGAPSFGDLARFADYNVAAGDDSYSTNNGSSDTAHDWLSGPAGDFSDPSPTINFSGGSADSADFRGMILDMNTGTFTGFDPRLTIYMADGADAPSGTITVTGSFDGGSAKFSDLIPGTYSYGTLGTGNALSLTVSVPEPLTAGPCAAFLILAAFGSRRRPQGARVAEP